MKSKLIEKNVEEIIKGLTPTDLILIFEAARIAMGDAEVCDKLAEDMDLWTDELESTRYKLQEIMDEN